MGGGSYVYSSAVTRSAAYADKSVKEIFTAQSINNAMSPHGVVVRESCDSEEHPESLAVIIALDVTGSMGTVPAHLIKEGLPTLMDKIMKAGIKDPQVLFLAIGDHECDRFPLQVSQFESSDELLNKWLEAVFLEGGGGGNAGESYALAWYFAAHHTAIDCFTKRGQKGILFTIGDEPTLKDFPQPVLKRLMGDGQYSSETADTLLVKAREKYEVFHVHIKETAAGSQRGTIDGWKQLVSDGLLIAEKHTQVAGLIADAVVGVCKPAIAATQATPARAPAAEEEVL